MATISRTGIAGGSTISPTHITNIIDALDGTSATTTVVASGSFSGSLTGNATSATTATTATSASYALSASYAANVPSTSSYALTALSASYAVTASYALNAGSGGSSFPFTGSAIISGSLRVTGSLDVSAGITATIVSTPEFIINSTTGSAGGNLLLDLSDIAKSGGTGKFIIPKQEPTSPEEGTMYWDTGDRVLYVYNEATTSWIAIGP
jgi:hypothetical protein